MKLANQIVLFLFLCCSSLQSFSQNYFIKNYGLKEGLPNNQLHDVLQAKDHTLWMSSMYGVFQFDGNTFKSFTKDQGLCSNQIRNIFEDSKGRIWCGAWKYEGISVIDDGVIFTPNDSVLKKQGVMTSAYEDAEGNIWLFGLTTIIKYNNKYFELIHQSSYENKQGYYHANSVVEGNNKNTVYASLLYDGIVKITLNPFKIEQQFNEKTHGINNICYSAFKDKEAVVWIGYYGGILSITNDKITKYDLPGDFNKNRVWNIAEDKDGYLWMALYGGGFVRWDKKEEYIFITSKNGLINDYCYDIIIDKENNKWIATEQAGLIKFRDFSFSYFDKSNGMPTDFTTSLAQKNETEIMIGTEKGLVTIIKNEVSNVSLLKQQINSITFDTNGDLWLATKEGYGVLKNDTVLLKNKAQTYFTAKNLGKLFIGGLEQIIINDSVFVEIQHINVITAIYIGKRLLVGFSGGVAEISRKGHKRAKHLSGLSFNTVYSSCSISDNEVFFGNPNELVYLKLIADTFLIKRFSKNRLNKIKGFNALCIKNEVLWIGSDNSLSKLNWKTLINKDSVVMQTITTTDGFINGKTAADGILCDNKGVIWLASSGGVMKFNPQAFNENKLPPQLKLNNVKLFSEPFSDSLYLKGGQLEFPYNQNHFTFNINAISLTNPDKVEYKYRLKGLDKTWIKTTQNNNIIYSYLPPGNYQFEFTASNGDGVWCKTPMSYSFTISVPFWDTIWFKTVGGLLFLLIISAIFYTQKKRAKNKVIIQEQFTEKLINAQEYERKRISKGLHDGIGQQLLIIKNAVTSNQFGEVPKMVNNTLEEVRSIARNLHPFQLEKLGLTKALATMIEEVSSVTKNLFFSEEIENIDNLLSKEKEINLYRILQECVNNILKHSQATASKLKITKTTSSIRIEIMDNGVGFDMTDSSDKLNSLGLKSIIERVKIINGAINFNSELGRGTKIIIIIDL